MARCFTKGGWPFRAISTRARIPGAKPIAGIAMIQAPAHAPEAGGLVCSDVPSAFIIIDHYFSMIHYDTSGAWQGFLMDV